MTKYNADNERIKRKYFAYLKEAVRNSEATVDASAKALSRFEMHTKHKDFKAFHYEQAIAFKKHLAEHKGQQSGEKLSKATLHATLTQLKRFFQWLAWQPGYKSRLQYSDAEYFNLSDKDTRIATTQREQKAPTLEQIKHVINTMPSHTDIEKRNRALIAFTLLTGARDSAIASMKLKHVDLIENCVNQDAREVNTKFSKTFNTFFFPVGDEIRVIIMEWATYLREEKLWGNDDPLFPATRITLSTSMQFETDGLDRKHWSNATPIRTIFRNAFTDAGLPYFNPHSFRNTLVRLGEEICKTPEQFKAWSQNLGHEKVLTTFLSYGGVACQRQGEIIRDLTKLEQNMQSDINQLAKAIAREMRGFA
ncbi:MAG: tyrosine-type recombinase/integrase [Nitrosomonas sp.]|uniref:tyrosine-type recombinase/integrase n=1 Tax=Nitrosomonas sp. TaxID=42353 RepID=UPI0027330EDC|nr:site-specific integrase [Nitrosomonas sp.]MDP3663738.1 tyrosine-type recombinase/integrase [Nitrosomonas sp.]MDZ4107029.1 tyrosine-type recombinase/integrase [Nitrosomonas sp.]